MDIKMEVEAYSGKKIDIDKALNEIERNVKQNGAQFKSGEMSKIRKLIHRSAKKHGHKTVYLTDCNMYAIEYNETEYKAIAKSTHKDYKHKEEEEEEIPLRITIEVTAALAGYFLGFIPHPFAQIASKSLIATGTGLCVDGILDRMEETEKNNKEKKR